MSLLQITPGEREALQMLALGAEEPVIAERLGVSEHQVGELLTTLFVNIGVVSKADAVAVALRRGLVDHGSAQLST